MRLYPVLTACVWSRRNNTRLEHKEQNALTTVYYLCEGSAVNEGIALHGEGTTTYAQVKDVGDQ